MIKKIYQVVCDNCKHTINDYQDGVALSGLKKDNIYFKYDKSTHEHRHFCCQVCLGKYEEEPKKEIIIKDVVYWEKGLILTCPKCKKTVKPTTGNEYHCSNCFTTFVPRVNF